MDIYDLLLGDPTDKAKMAEVAKQLRGQEALGVLGVLSGDPAMGQFGTGQIKQAQERAGGLRRARQAATTARALGGGAYEQGGEIKTLPGYQEEQERGFQNQLLLQALKNRGKGESAEHTKMTKWVSDMALGTTSAVTEMEGLLRDFKPEYAQMLGPGPQSALPNAAARMGLGTEMSKEAQQWWARWAESLTLPQRNEIFGATLARNEKGSWEQIDINPNMDPAQIIARITDKTNLTKRKQNQQRGMFEAEGYRPATLDAIYGASEPVTAEDVPGVGGEEGVAPVDTSGYETPEAVGEALQAGDIDMAEAERIWRSMGIE